MKYRVIFKVNYYEAWFEFDTVEEAGEFAKTILTHQVESEDNKRKSMIRLEVIDTSLQNKEDVEDDD
jgi:hypothetical protein